MFKSAKYPNTDAYALMWEIAEIYGVHRVPFIYREICKDTLC